MTGPTRRDIERQIDQLTATENVASEIQVTIDLPAKYAAELRDHEPGTDLSADLAAAIRQADLKAIGAITE